MPTYKIVIAYDGTHYCGWQVQLNGISIQSKIDAALKVVARCKDIQVAGSGRTDAGVHARGQVAHFNCKHSLDLFKALPSVNALLPPDIRILSFEEVDDDFHARYSAIGKEYHYYIHLNRVLDPFQRLYTWQCRPGLDTKALEEAATLFVGTHDFSSFANETYAGAAAKDPIRTISKLNVCRTEEGLRLEFYGNGFLYKMVRNMVGCLVHHVGYGKMNKEQLSLILEAKDRRAGKYPAAPPQGLFLHHVDYPQSL